MNGNHTSTRKVRDEEVDVDKMIESLAFFPYSGFSAFVDTNYLKFVYFFRDYYSQFFDYFNLWKNFDFMLVMVYMIFLLIMQYVIHSFMHRWLAFVFTIAYTYHGITTTPNGNAILPVVMTLTLLLIRVRRLFPKTIPPHLDLNSSMYHAPREHDSFCRAMLTTTPEAIPMILFITIAIIASRTTDNIVLSSMPMIMALMVTMITSSRVGGNSNWMMMAIFLIFLASLLYYPPIYKFANSFNANLIENERPPTHFTPVQNPGYVTSFDMVRIVFKEFFRMPGLPPNSFFLIVHVVSGALSSYLTCESVFSTSDATAGALRVTKPSVNFQGMVTLNKPWMFAFMAEFLIVFALGGLERLLVCLLGYALGYALYMLRGRAYWESIGAASAGVNWMAKGHKSKIETNICDRPAIVAGSCFLIALLYSIYVHISFMIIIIAVLGSIVAWYPTYFLFFSGLLHISPTIMIMGLYKPQGIYTNENETVGSDTATKIPADDSATIGIGANSSTSGTSDSATLLERITQVLKMAPEIPYLETCEQLIYHTTTNEPPDDMMSFLRGSADFNLALPMEL